MGFQYSVRSVVDSTELASGLGATNISFHRPAATTYADGSPLPSQAIPRHIVQTGNTWTQAYRHHHGYMRTWLDHNPEYEYSFFGDEHASRFMARHGTEREREAYGRILTGSQRADQLGAIGGSVGSQRADEDVRVGTVLAGEHVEHAEAPLLLGATFGLLLPVRHLPHEQNCVTSR